MFLISATPIYMMANIRRLLKTGSEPDEDPAVFISIARSKLQSEHRKIYT
jgi:hypothetical protein